MKGKVIFSLSTIFVLFGIIIIPVNSKQDQGVMNYQPSLRAFSKLLECEPSQISLSLGDLYGYVSDQVDRNDITITFHTKSECSDMYIEVGQTNQISSSRKQENVHSVFDNTFCHNDKDCETVHYNRHIHHFKINLRDQGPFTYQIIGEDNLYSEPQQIYNASIPKRLSKAQHKFIYFGDLDNAKIADNTFDLLDVLITEDIKAIIFLGDYGYQFYQNNGKQGDKFLTSIQPYASIKPWMTTAGNHEDNLNYTFFNDKFRMPNYKKSNNHYYSFDVGLVHFISLNFQFYNDGEDLQSAEVKQQMLNWLADDLRQANSNRDQVPWIIGFGHKSIYCVSSECNDFPELYARFDDLFYQNGVDLFIGAHKHEYQFLKPIYNQIVQGYERPDNHTIQNPNATVYVIQGNGGNINMMQSELGQKHFEYLLANDAEPGLGRLTVINRNEILLEYIRAQSQSVMDYQKIIKDTHQAY